MPHNRVKKFRCMNRPLKVYNISTILFEVYFEEISGLEIFHFLFIGGLWILPFEETYSEFLCTCSFCLWELVRKVTVFSLEFWTTQPKVPEWLSTQDAWESRLLLLIAIPKISGVVGIFNSIFRLVQKIVRQNKNDMSQST